MIDKQPDSWSPDPRHADPLKLRQHELKTWPEFFGPVFDGVKTFELRKADRDYRVGDELWLREWFLSTGYTGRECWRIVTFVAPSEVFWFDEHLLKEGYVLLGIKESLAELVSLHATLRETERQRDEQVNEIWEDVLKSVLRAWDNPPAYLSSPLELVSALIDERDTARASLEERTRERDVWRDMFEASEATLAALRVDTLARRGAAEATLRAAQAVVAKRKHACSSCDIDDEEWARREGYNEALKAVEGALGSSPADKS